MKTLLKVCGATSVSDVELLAKSGADLVGLWHGVPDGPTDLSTEDFVTLAKAATEVGLHPVLVTFAGGAASLHDVVERSGVRWVQLHAYQPPATVRALVAAGCTVVKVLHVQSGRCQEQALIGAYQRAGADFFLLDAVTTDGRIGSTGHRLAPAHVVAVAVELDRPFLLAGGISADCRDDYDLVAAHPRFAGIDVDTAARDNLGNFDATAITAITHAWRTKEL